MKETIVTIMITFLALTSCAKSEKAVPIVSLETPPPSKVTPVKIVILLDKSGSAPDHAVPQINVDDLQPLIGFLTTRGGELAIGEISSKVHRPLIRLRVDNVPPPPPIKPAPLGNAFRDADAAEDYRIRITSHQAETAKFNAEVDRIRDIFIRDVMPLAMQKAEAKKTDIWGALRQSDLFLMEAESATPIRRYLLLLTDGKDTAGGYPVAQLKSQPKMLLVNSSASDGVLARFDPLKFESFAAAVRFIIHDKNGGKDANKK